jgi:hypothetical protein
VATGARTTGGTAEITGPSGDVLEVGNSASGGDSAEGAVPGAPSAGPAVIVTAVVVDDVDTLGGSRLSELAARVDEEARSVSVPQATSTMNGRSKIAAR